MAGKKGKGKPKKTKTNKGKKTKSELVDMYAGLINKVENSLDFESFACCIPSEEFLDSIGFPTPVFVEPSFEELHNTVSLHRCVEWVKAWLLVYRREKKSSESFKVLALSEVEKEDFRRKVVCTFRQEGRDMIYRKLSYAQHVMGKKVEALGGGGEGGDGDGDGDVASVGDALEESAEDITEGVVQGGVGVSGALEAETDPFPALGYNPYHTS